MTVVIRAGSEADVVRGERIAAFLEASEKVAPMVRFMVANEMGIPSELADMAEWLEAWERVRGRK